MTFTVYILRDDTGRLYKGATNDLDRRIREHKSGHTKTTRKMSGLHVVYKEEFVDWPKARRRELYLKSAAGRKFLKDKLSMSR